MAKYIHSLILMIQYKILFLLKFKTLRSKILLNRNEIAVCCSKGIFKLDRRCPHQGAFLENSYQRDNILTCHWHGCKIVVDAKGKKM